MVTTRRQTPRYESFTPRQAQNALKRVHPNQRNIRPGVVSRYQDYIKSGDWHPEGATPAKVDVNGLWIDGIHRLTAISKLPTDHKPVDMLVLRNVPTEALPYIDTGANRTLADQLGYAFDDLKYGQNIATIIGACIKYDPKDPVLRFDTKPNPREAIEFLERHEQKLREVARIASSVANADGPKGRHAERFVTPKTLGWLLFQTIENPRAEQFWQDYADGEYSVSADPRGQMLTYFRKHPDVLQPGAMSRQQFTIRAAALSQAWNSKLLGRKWRAWDGDPATFPHPLLVAP